jgi:hypothetical protein
MTKLSSAAFTSALGAETGRFSPRRRECGVFQGFDLLEDEVLEVRRQFLKVAEETFKAGVGATVEHFPLASAEEAFVHAVNHGNQFDDPVVDPPVPQFDSGVVAVGKENTPAKLGLGQFKSQSDLLDPRIDPLVNGFSACFEGRTHTSS